MALLQKQTDRDVAATLAPRLKAARAASRQTLKALSAATGLSQPFLSRLERGQPGSAPRPSPHGDGAGARRGAGLAAFHGRGGERGITNQDTTGRETAMSETGMPARKFGDHSFEAVHESERPWETLRFGGF